MKQHTCLVRCLSLSLGLVLSLCLILGLVGRDIHGRWSAHGLAPVVPFAVCRSGDGGNSQGEDSEELHVGVGFVIEASDETTVGSTIVFYVFDLDRDAEPELQN